MICKTCRKKLNIVEWDIQYSWMERLNTVKMHIFHKFICKFNSIST